jgi:hypothetical protein
MSKNWRDSFEPVEKEEVKTKSWKDSFEPIEKELDNEVSELTKPIQDTIINPSEDPEGYFKQKADRESKATKEVGQTFGAMTMGALSGLTWGFDDEIQALAESAFSDKTYGQELKEARDYRDKLKDESPWASGIGEFGTGILTGSAVAKGLGKLGMKGLRAAGAAGVLEGATMAAGQTKEELLSGEGVKDVAIGGSLGGVFGTLLPLAGMGIKKVINSTAPTLSKLPLIGGLDGNEAAAKKYNQYLDDIELYKKDKALSDTDMEGEVAKQIQQTRSDIKEINKIAYEKTGINKDDTLNDYIDIKGFNDVLTNFMNDPKYTRTMNKPQVKKVFNNFMNDPEFSYKDFREDLGNLAFEKDSKKLLGSKASKQIKELYNEVSNPEIKKPIIQHTDKMYNASKEIMKFADDSLMTTKNKRETGRTKGWMTRILMGKPQKGEFDEFNLYMDTLKEESLEMKEGFKGALKEHYNMSFNKDGIDGFEPISKELDETIDNTFKQLESVFDNFKDISESAISIRTLTGKKQLYSEIKLAARNAGVIASGINWLSKALLVPVSNPPAYLDMLAGFSKVSNNFGKIAKMTNQSLAKIKAGGVASEGSMSKEERLKERLKAYNEKVKKVNLDDKKDLKFKPQ